MAIAALYFSLITFLAESGTSWPHKPCRQNPGGLSVSPPHGAQPAQGHSPAKSGLVGGQGQAVEPVKTNASSKVKLQEFPFHEETRRNWPEKRELKDLGLMCNLHATQLPCTKPKAIQTAEIKPILPQSVCKLKQAWLWKLLCSTGQTLVSVLCCCHSQEPKVCSHFPCSFAQIRVVSPRGAQLSLSTSLLPHLSRKTCSGLGKDTKQNVISLASGYKAGSGLLPG